ncbi:MAG TPA: extracellular solute-binding protein [Rectinemataceae bacterium]|nr:extracellular solute-binding protein [Rectinemataceae bacterium]
MKSKSRIASLAVCAVLAFCLVNAAQAQIAAKQGKDIVLKFAYKQTNSDPLEKWLKDKTVIEQFEAANPGVKIQLSPIPSSEGDYATVLALQLSSVKTAPDIFMEDTYMTATDAASGYLACLDDYLAQWPDWSNYLDGTKAAVKGADGKYYGIPISTDSRGIWYSYGVLKNAGIKTPWQPKNWAEILDAARKIKKYDSGVAPLYLVVGAVNGEAVSMQTFEMLLYGTGDQMFENGKWLVKSEGLLDTFKFIDTVCTKEKLSVGLDISLSKDGQAIAYTRMFPQNKIGMSFNVCTVMGLWIPTGPAPIKDLEQTVGFAAMPTQNGGDPATVTMCGGWSWAISEYSKNKDMAFRFLAFCGNKENATFRSLYDGRMSPRKDSISIKQYASRPFSAEMTANMKNSFVRPKSEAYAMVSSQIQALVEEMVSGSFTPEQAAEQYRVRVTNIVGKENVFSK